MHAAILSLLVFAGGVDDGCCNGECRADRQRGRCFGAMPQTCYNPRYGCYGSNNRWMHRYPAFHGTYYRAPYNYRNVFDYPWHAGLHEPTSLFSYNVPEQQTDQGVDSLPEPIELQPRSQTVPDEPSDEFLPPLNDVPSINSVPGPPMVSGPPRKVEAIRFRRVSPLVR